MRARLDRLQIGARARLRHRDRADQLAAGHPRQPALLLFLGAVVEQVVRDDAVHRMTEAGDAATAELLDHDRLVTNVAADPTVAVGNVGAQEANLAGLVPQLPVDVVLLSEARVVRQDLALDEAARRIAEQLEFLVHPWRSIVGHACRLSRSP